MRERILNKNDSFLTEALFGKSILITGSTGLIGSNILFYLAKLNDTLEAKIKIIALFRNDLKRDQLFGKYLMRTDIIFVKCDVEREITFEFNVDYIIHCAGFSGGSKMHLKDPVKIFDTGIGGTKRLLDFAVKSKCCGFLYISTYEIYGDSTNGNYITENQASNLDTFSLRNCYAEIKRLCESLLCAYSAEYGLPVYSARLTSTFGNGVQYSDPRFFAEFARCIIEGRDIVLKSAGKTVRSYLDAEDAAMAFLYILANGESGNAYNVTNMENEISIKDMALKMIEITKSPVKLIIDEKAGASKLGFRKEGKTVMDNSKLRALGWEPVYTLDDTIGKMIDSMRYDKKHLVK